MSESRRALILRRLEIKRERLLLYHEAEAAILSGQSYRIENLLLTRPDLERVQVMIASLENEIEKLENELLASNERRARFRAMIPGAYLPYGKRKR